MPRKTHSEIIEGLQVVTAKLEDHLNTAIKEIESVKRRQELEQQKLVDARFEIVRLTEPANALEKGLDGMKTRFWALAIAVVVAGLGLIVNLLIKRNG